MKSVLRNMLGLGLAGIAALTSPTAFSASAEAVAEITGVSVTTTGTAAMTFMPGSEALAASGLTTGGVPDAFNDGMTFDSETSFYGEGTATTGGLPTLFSSSFAAASADTFSPMNESSALTFTDVEMELSGIGSVILDFTYDLVVDTFDNSADAFAAASLFATTGDAVSGTAFADVSLDAPGLPGPGVVLEDLGGVLTLEFAVDDFGIAPYFDILTVGTEASVKASVVPLPGAVWLFGSALAGLVGVGLRGRGQPAV